MSVTVQNKVAGKPKVKNGGGNGGAGGNGGEPPKRDRSDELVEIWQALDALSTGAIERSKLHRQEISAQQETMRQQIEELQALKRTADQLLQSREAFTQELHAVRKMVGESDQEVLRNVTEAIREEAEGRVQFYDKYKAELRASVENIEQLKIQVANLGRLIDKRDEELRGRLEKAVTDDRVVEAISAARESLDDGLGHTLGAINKAHSDLAGQVGQLVTRLEELDRAHNKRTDTLEEQVQVAVGADQVAEQITEAARSLEEKIGATAEATGNQVNVLQEQLEIINAKLVEMSRIADQHVERFTAENNATSERVDYMSGSIASFVKALDTVREEFKAYVETAERQMRGNEENLGNLATRQQAVEKAFNDSAAVVEQLTASVAERLETIAKDSASVISSLPKKLILNSKGVLLAVDGTGETAEIGKVVGDRGTDGATIRDIRLNDDLLELVMSDERCLKVKFPVANSKPIVKDGPQGTRGRRKNDD